MLVPHLDPGCRWALPRTQDGSGLQVMETPPEVKLTLFARHPVRMQTSHVRDHRIRLILRRLEKKKKNKNFTKAQNVTPQALALKRLSWVPLASPRCVQCEPGETLQKSPLKQAVTLKLSMCGALYSRNTLAAGSSFKGKGRRDAS